MLANMRNDRKFTKEQVNYQFPNMIPYKCRTCVHYIKSTKTYGPACKEVLGVINKDGNCDIFNVNGD